MSFRLHGKDIARILKWLLVRLDGRYTFEELVQQSDEFPPGDMAAILAAMLRYRIVENADVAPLASLFHEEVKLYEAQHTFFSHFSQNPNAFQATLKDAHLVILGVGPVGAQAALCLALSGIGHIKVVDDSLVTQELAASGTIYDQTEIGEFSSEVIANRLRKINPFIQVSSSAMPVTCAADVRAGTKGATLALLCAESASNSICEWTNEASLQQKFAWTSARIEDFIGMIGPTVFPFQTSCYKCYELRRKSNFDEEDLEEALAWERLVSHQDAVDFDNGLLPAFAPLLGAAVAVEALKILTLFEKPTASNAVWEIDFLTLKAIVRPLLKLPRCPACGGNRPATSPWSER